MDMECATDVKDKKVKPLPDSATLRLRRLEKDVGELRRMVTELVTAQLAATRAASSDLSSDNGCNHGAATLFTEELTPSIEYFMAFVE